jgi:hypothetical protein
MSFGLRKLLSDIQSNHDDRISKILLSLHKNSLSPISYIDRTGKIDMILFTQSSKMIPEIEERGVSVSSSDIYNFKKGWMENRNLLKIGRFVSTILQYNKIDFSLKELETFTNRFKNESKKDLEDLTFRGVMGSDINRWYSKKMYLKGGGTLNRSCMRSSERNSFLNFYSVNPRKCRLKILLNGQKRLLGRALLWKLDEPQGSVFMDRVYTRFDDDSLFFENSANKLGYLYKSKQTYGGDIPLINGKTGEKKWVKMVIKGFKKQNFKGYPYMDTLQYYNPKTETLTNDENDFLNGKGNFIKLNQINGSFISLKDYINGNSDEVDMLGF